MKSLIAWPGSKGTIHITPNTAPLMAHDFTHPEYR